MEIATIFLNHASETEDGKESNYNRKRGNSEKQT